MSNKMLKVTRIEFCGLENNSSDALSVAEERFFQDKDGKTAHYWAGEYISSKPVMMYLGLNGEVYPQFRLKEVSVG